MAFFRQILVRCGAWMRRRNGLDVLSIAMLCASVLLQLIGSWTGWYVLLLLSLVLYGVSIFRVFSVKSYKREAENTKFMTWWTGMPTRIRQFFLRLKLRRYYRYFKCPRCAVLLRVKRGEGEKEIRCPRCGNRFSVRS